MIESAPILQDWVPLTQCLDWQLGQLAFQRRGVQAFSTQEVPNLINQGGLPALRAGEVLFEHCRELDAAGTLEPEIRVLELGMGLGLHALQVLDRFAALCAAEGRDYYDRLTFYATDGTPRVLSDARDRQVFARHAGRVVLGLANALDPCVVTPLDSVETVDLTGRLRAVLHTYVLCVLPANIYHWTPVADAWKVLLARTVLRHADELANFTHLDVAEVQALAKSDSPLQKLPLVPLFPLIDLDLALADVPVDELREAAEVRAAGQLLAEHLPNATELWVLHSAGALHSLKRTLEGLRPDGIVLYRDYGPATAERANTHQMYQHYGPTTAAGIHFLALDAWLTGLGAQVSVPPEEGEAAIKTRLVSRAPLPETRRAFAERFSAESMAQLEQKVTRARQLRDRPQEALEAYRQALLVEKHNWLLLAEAGAVALRRARQVDLAQTLLTESLRIHPWNAEVWNDLGDLHWTLGRFAQAAEAYRRAVTCHPEDARGWLNLAGVAKREGDWAEVLVCTAKALAHDATGDVADQGLTQLMGAAAELRKRRAQMAAWRQSRRAGTAS
ncbi:MAG: tetratricopeptide repeat protein [Myxococcota bacterium]